MDELDIDEKPDLAAMDDHDLLMQHVVGDDHELLYLDTYLGELFSKEKQLG